MKLNEIVFKEVNRRDVSNMLLKKHYLHRMPPLSFAYGAYYNDELVGCLTFGKPPSNSLCRGVCGNNYEKYVIELNRLYTNDDTPRNTESKLISYGLNKLKQKGNFIIISYADKNMGHSGYVYQATNWIYSGHSAKRTDVYVGAKGHSRTYTEEQSNFVIRAMRSAKHRYIYMVGNKKFKKDVLKNLKYPIVEQYPKEEPCHYSDNDGDNKILYHKITKQIFTEKEFLAHPEQFLSKEELKKFNEIYRK